MAAEKMLSSKPTEADVAVATDIADEPAAPNPDAVDGPSVVKANVTAEELMARLADEDDEFGDDVVDDVAVRQRDVEVAPSARPSRRGSAPRIGLPYAKRLSCRGLGLRE